MNLRDAIERAAEIAYEQDASQYVITKNNQDWSIVHEEDPEAFASGICNRFAVESDGINVGHIERGEITSDLELPE